VSNTTIPTVCIRRTGNRPSPAVAQGGGQFFQRGQAPAGAGGISSTCRLRDRQGLGFRLETFSGRPINYKFGGTFFLHSRPYCGFRLITYCTLFAYLKNHCLFAMASRLQCETSSRSWKIPEYTYNTVYSIGNHVK